MQQAYCSECGTYVTLDENGTCPQGHPRPCYRDIRNLDPGAAVAGARIAPVKPSRDSVTATPSTTRKWFWVVVGCLAVLLAMFVGIVAALGLRSPAPEPSAPSSQQASAPAEPKQIVSLPDGSYPPALAQEADYTSPSAEQQRWALATCGILTEMNQERHDLLGGCDQTPGNVQVAKQILANGWGIASREDLLATLTWIEQGGHRRDFDALVYGLSAATPAQLEDLRAQAAQDPEIANKVNLAQRYGSELGSKSLAGWDFGRYVFLCRRGYLVGYLSEEEAWRKIMPVAQLMQATFTSWKDLGDNYLVGRQFWSLQQSQQNAAAWQEAERRLLTDQQGPWTQLPWGLEL